jgi:hypothetical protein
MIVEYIRYKIDPSRTDEFNEALSPRRRAARCVTALRALGGRALLDEPEKQIVRIE